TAEKARPPRRGGRPWSRGQPLGRGNAQPGRVAGGGAHRDGAAHAVLAAVTQVLAVDDEGEAVSGGDAPYHGFQGDLHGLRLAGGGSAQGVGLVRDERS